ncbi:PAS domain-containing protein [Arthrobacter sp. zg-Y40]|uniref:helix-turn-helix transcriptional regulator n=1 Tax=unclassified Arthrobacter TaxID=235627 RepID=UPI001D134E0F|nr:MULTISPECIES: PAS domain-containing protein [unclassified Arthrobacter]MCC3279960.1 PAS domain-containing protein [Arthrobacter sp. zg-Y40]MDK1328310.1 PAS domain-containing protein [Arthrobacter sp. zg-Y1143]
MRATQVDLARELRPEFAPYLGMMDFLGALLGPRSEIVLHDTTDLNRSVVALTNGYVSGRALGAPATDLVLKVLRNGEHHDTDYFANYLAESAAGGRFRSSTFFIRDSEAAVIGLLCINIDDTALVAARDALDALTATGSIRKEAATAPNSTPSPYPPAPIGAVAERLSTSVEDLTLDSVSRHVASQNVPPLRMTSDEKMAIVRDLDEAGTFLLKGSVAKAASALHVSEPTVYRYLKQVRQEA